MEHNGLQFFYRLVAIHRNAPIRCPTWNQNVNQNLIRHSFTLYHVFFSHALALVPPSLSYNPVQKGLLPGMGSMHHFTIRIVLRPASSFSLNFLFHKTGYVVLVIY